MHQADVKIGKFYLVKVSGRLTTVQVIDAHANGGWKGRNVRTGHEIRIRTSRRLRREVVLDQQIGPKAPTMRQHLRTEPLNPPRPMTAGQAHTMSLLTTGKTTIDVDDLGAIRALYDHVSNDVRENPCDHSVGICACHLIRALEHLHNSLGLK